MELCVTVRNFLSAIDPRDVINVVFNSEYSDEDGEVESDEDRPEVKSAKAKYQELRTTYTRSLTPESEPEYQCKPADADDEEYEEEDDDEDVEDEEVEDEEEEESDAAEYEKEDDDEELLKRLEAKYGKLKRGEQADKREDLDEQFSSWKRNNFIYELQTDYSFALLLFHLFDL